MEAMSGAAEDVNVRRYTLRSLPGTFSGLGMVCLMYTGFQRIKPGTDVGFDLGQEYAAAQQLFSGAKDAA